MAELFDTRLYRLLSVNNAGAVNAVPHYRNAGTFIYEYFESPESVKQGPFFKEVENGTLDEKEILDASTRAGKISEYIEKNNFLNNPDFNAPFSAIHPFALIRLAGGHGSMSGDTTDITGRRKFYEIDGHESGNYASNPTTTALINWGNQDERGRFPYSFQDFVFCKYWNKIENNRLITLRRYPTPVVDAVIPGANPDDANKEASDIYAPVCTAVTYFGEGTDNKLSDILKFSVGYEWKEIEGDLWKVSSQQPEEGHVINGPHWLEGGLAQITKMVGVLGDLSGTNEIVPTNSVGLAPDPYNSGPYENRIWGPMNVIKKVYKREPGLKFTNDGLTISFSYVARPIANINNKAILLDLLANILLMTSSSGTFFGGMRRYRCEKPAVYPWRNMDSINKLYRGQLFGKDSAAASLVKGVWNDTGTFMTNFAKDLLDGVKAVAANLLAGIRGEQISDEEKKERDDKINAAKKQGRGIKETMGRAVAAHLLKGTTIPWIEGMHALLTGDPVGDWHLTIGNPLNPIAMIGNLIVDNCEVTFDDELGPDDFPIGFTAKITLKHGMPRDKDAVESMFNRGTGRIYMLSDSFKTSADMETKVDESTGGVTKRTSVDSSSFTAFSGSDYIHSISNPPLPNRINNNEYSQLLKHDIDLSLMNNEDSIYGSYKISPWTMHWIL